MWSLCIPPISLIFHLLQRSARQSCTSQAARLRHLAAPDGKADFQAWAASPGRTLLEALQEFPSARPPLGASISAFPFWGLVEKESDVRLVPNRTSGTKICLALVLIHGHEICTCNGACYYWGRRACPSVFELLPKLPSI